MGILWEEDSFGIFLLVTVFLGGGAAYLTGRAMAINWGRIPQLVVYVLLLNCAVRFIHFALFGGTLLSLHYYLADLVVLLLFAGCGFRITRAGQMTEQYGWLYRRAGPLSWSDRAAADGSAQS